MMIPSTIILLITVASSLALPNQFSGLKIFARKSGGGVVNYRDLEETLTTVPIHASCNVTERRQLLRALDDALEVVSVARDYVLKYGNEDPVYQLYFGAADPFAVVGIFDNLIYGDKDGVLFRCDNIDGNCANPGWAGHWRGENATLETVICPLSYEARKWKEQWCGFGYTVAEGSAGFYFATDLIHRLFHVPTISNEVVSHYADAYADVLELAKHNATFAPINTHTLQYLASDVYARVIGNPGVGCVGTVAEPEDDGHDHSSSSSAASLDSTPTTDTNTISTTGLTLTPTPTPTGVDCHTHANGETHCE